MTKPQTEAERMANEFSQQHEELMPINGPRWRNADIDLAIQMASKSGYLAGFKAAVAFTETLVDEMINANFPASTSEIKGAIILKNKLKLLLIGKES